MEKVRDKCNFRRISSAAVATAVCVGLCSVDVMRHTCPSLEQAHVINLRESPFSQAYLFRAIRSRVCVCGFQGAFVFPGKIQTHTHSRISLRMTKSTSTQFTSVYACT